MKFLQNLGKSLMMPVAVLPVAAILMGVGNWIGGAFGSSAVSVFFLKSGGAVLDNLALLFAIGIAFGMAKKSDGVAALSGLVSWLVVTVLLSPGTVAGVLGGIDVAEVDPAFGAVQNVFVGINRDHIYGPATTTTDYTKIPTGLNLTGKLAAGPNAANLSPLDANDSVLLPSDDTN